MYLQKCIATSHSHKYGCNFYISKEELCMAKKVLMLAGDFTEDY